MNGCVTDMMTEALGKAYKAIKKMGARPGDCGEEAGFTLASHVEQSLTPQLSVELMADYFSSISQQYEPLSVQNLPESVRFVMETPVNSCDIPHIVEWEVWKGMKTGKNIKSSVPGEHPARLRHEFGPELAGPASIIFNKIASTGQWLDHWKEG